MIRQNGQSLQEQFAPSSICFGCGPANEKGLQIRSIVDGDHTSAVWQPQTHHEAFPNVLSGGIIGTLLDCHSNWTAAWAIMNNQQAKNPPCTVTAEYKVKLMRPCRLDIRWKWRHGSLNLTRRKRSFLLSSRQTEKRLLHAREFLFRLQKDTLRTIGGKMRKVVKSENKTNKYFFDNATKFSLCHNPLTKLAN